MALTNHERVGKGLELLREGLQPFVERELRACYGDDWQVQAREAVRDYGSEPINWDSHALLAVLWYRWDAVFGKQFGRAQRSLISELRDVRNSWAHQKTFSSDDTYRALDSVQRLLQAVAAPGAAEVERLRLEVLRLRFEEQTRAQSRRLSTETLRTGVAGGLPPWREVITPHPDVASGNYRQAEFAADLNQVYRGEGSDEYRDPRQFYARTYLTEGLRQLLIGALRRLAGTGGDPVVQLQTNFGGGKTHSMLALYHLVSGVRTAELPGMDTVLRDAGVDALPAVRRAVLVGYALSPGQVHTKEDGTEVHTLWGELAWQLLGTEGYRMLAETDRRGVSPGADVLGRLFERAAPCLVLIDEWVAHLRNLYHASDLPAGSFDTNLTFAQALTEAAKASPRTLVVATLPASQIEVGGEGGQEALERLQNTFGRIESTWRPASAEESFEIVRRRLFESIADPALHTARDTVARAFAETYRGQAREFPAGCGEGQYERRIRAAYPIHPELFDRLYDDWSSLERFQRTRGVLRLMSAVIHALWEREDRSLLIMPGSVPIHEPRVQDELTRYLEANWRPIIDVDVDGPAALPLRLDRENATLGRYSACRRVARTIFLGSAPTLGVARRGLEDRRIRLGCVQPGESTATFGDALRRLSDGATHLYVEGGRYWYSTQPSVARLAQDRAAQQDEDAVTEEIERRLRAEAGRRGDFSRIHACPQTSADVPDEREARLVILRPHHPHVARSEDSKARATAMETLGSRGTGPRTNRNALVFLAPDRARLDELEQAVRQFLAWTSIDEEKETLNLDPQQAKQAHAKRTQADETVKQRIPEAYAWLLVPGQPDPNGPMEWQEYRLQGQGGLAERASRKLRNEELLITQLGGVRLRMELDRIPLWRGDHVGVRQLADDVAQYLYLPRLRDTDVLLSAVGGGVQSLIWRQDGFAYAEAWDEAEGRYRGLHAGGLMDEPPGLHGLLVRPEAAARQLAADAAERQETPGQSRGSEPAHVPAPPPDGGATADPPQAPPAPTRPTESLKRYYGSVALSSARLERDASQVWGEIVQHLESQVGAKVIVTLDIQAEIPGGVPDDVYRTVTENARTLGFVQSEFELG